MHATLRARGVALLLCGVQPELHSYLDSTRLADALGPERVFSAADGEARAVEVAFHLLRESAEELRIDVDAIPASDHQPVDPGAHLAQNVVRSPGSSTPRE